MFNERQDEVLVWVKLDLDTISQDVQAHGLVPMKTTESYPFECSLYFCYQPFSFWVI